jgi:hypothetical protein
VENWKRGLSVGIKVHDIISDFDITVFCFWGGYDLTSTAYHNTIVLERQRLFGSGGSIAGIRKRGKGALLPI